MKYKKCPACGKMNAVRNTICDEPDCGESLIGVSVIIGMGLEQTPQSSAYGLRTANVGSQEMDSAAESGDTPSSSAKSVVSGPSYMRQCPSCKKMYPYRHKRCECGTSLIGVPPCASAPVASNDKDERQAVQMSKYMYVLISEDGQAEIELKDGVDIIIGREATGSDYLENRNFVSRQHARIIVSRDSVSLEHIGSNPSLVNGKELKKKMPYSLNEGDLIAFGAYPYQYAHPRAAYFRLRRKMVE